MRATVTIDDEIFQDLMRLSDAKSRSGAVNQALSEWVRRRRLAQLKAMRGKLEIADDLETLRAMELGNRGSAKV